MKYPRIVPDDYGHKTFNIETGRNWLGMTKVILDPICGLVAHPFLTIEDAQKFIDKHLSAAEGTGK